MYLNAFLYFEKYEHFVLLKRLHDQNTYSVVGVYNIRIIQVGLSRHLQFSITVHYRFADMPNAVRANSLYIIYLRRTLRLFRYW